MGFFLGTMELTMWVMYYTFRSGFREAVGHPIVEGEAGSGDEDLIAASVIVAVDMLANALLICGANKDYSGRRKDLRYAFRSQTPKKYGKVS